ncbi:MAG: hypothetical protein ACSHX3_08370 [Litorimonas sp.]
MLISSIVAPPPSSPPPNSSQTTKDDPSSVDESAQSGSETQGTSGSPSQTEPPQETAPSSSTTQNEASSNNKSPDNSSSASEPPPPATAPAVASSTPQGTEAIVLSNAVSELSVTATGETASQSEASLRDAAIASVESRKLSSSDNYTDQLFGNVSLTDLLKSSEGTQTVEPRTVLTEAVEAYQDIQSYKGEDARVLDSV